MSTENAAAPAGFESASGNLGRRLVKTLLSTGTIFLLLFILWIWITILNPTFAEPGPFLAYLKRSAPLVILAAGSYFVLISGNFDLSVGALCTVMVVVAARLIDGDPSQHVAGRRRAAADRGRRRVRQRLHLDGHARAVVHHDARHVADIERGGAVVVGRRAEGRAVRELPFDRT